MRTYQRFTHGYAAVLVAFSLLFFFCEIGCMPQGTAQQTSDRSGFVANEKSYKAPVRQQLSYKPLVPLDSLRDSLVAGLRFQSLGGARLVEVVNSSVKSLEAVRLFLPNTAIPNIIIKVYPTVEAKGLLTRNTDVAHIDESTNTIHRVGHAAFALHQDEMLPKLIASSALGKPSLNAFETGLAVYMTEHWRKKGYRYWASLIHKEGFISLKEILDNAFFEKESRLVMSCMSGVLVEFLVEKWGKASFLERYQQGLTNMSRSELLMLDKLWHGWMNQHLKTPPTPLKRTIPKGLKGFNFTHEGYNINDGYSGNRAACALDTLDAIGANAIAIVPYTFMRDPNKPSRLPLPQQHPGGEHDEGVIYCLHQAKRLNMFTMMKPQVWMGGGHWPGDVEMNSEEDWRAFFNYYHRWIRHYALLAAMYETDALCIGVEFAKATQQRPEDWKELARSMRKIYPGIITYAANWGEEFKHMGFADALDVVGLNCYYPLGNSDSMSYAQLKDAFTDRLQKIEKQSKAWGTPVWFTEIGYPSLAMPWQRPHAEPRGMPSSPAHQARCYAATLDAIAAFETPMSQFWWKWATNPPAADLHDKEFMPTAKPAQEVLRRYWANAKK